MVKGGYQIIDLEDRNFTKLSTQNYKGIYEKLYSTRKPSILSGIKIDGVKQRDVFANFRKTAADQYKCYFDCTIGNTSQTINVTVYNTDSVMITW